VTGSLLKPGCSARFPGTFPRCDRILYIWLSLLKHTVPSAVFMAGKCELAERRISSDICCPLASAIHLAEKRLW
jgi:hypothetical protein